MDEIDDIGSNRSTAPSIGTVISRRAALQGGLARWRRGRRAPCRASASRRCRTAEDAEAEGHRRQVVLRWGDPVLPGAPPFDPLNQTAEAQARQFGTNVDFLALLPAERGGTTERRALLWANHEYASTSLMFPGLGTGREARSRVTAEQAAVEMAAPGGSVVEVEWRGGTWVADPRGGGTGASPPPRRWRSVVRLPATSACGPWRIRRDGVSSACCAIAAASRPGARC